MTCVTESGTVRFLITYEKKEKRIKKDAKVLHAFIGIYCRENHIKKGIEAVDNCLCASCSELLEYALKRNDKCPLDPKPQCKKNVTFTAINLRCGLKSVRL